MLERRPPRSPSPERDAFVAKVMNSAGSGEHMYEGERSPTGLREGHGVYRYFDGDTYEGEWCDNMRHGKGISHHVNGGKYEG